MYKHSSLFPLTVIHLEKRLFYWRLNVRGNIYIKGNMILELEGNRVENVLKTSNLFESNIISFWILKKWFLNLKKKVKFNHRDNSNTQLVIAETFSKLENNYLKYLAVTYSIQHVQWVQNILYQKSQNVKNVNISSIWPS